MYCIPSSFQQFERVHFEMFLEMIEELFDVARRSDRWKKFEAKQKVSSGFRVNNIFRESRIFYGKGNLPPRPDLNLMSF